MAPADRMIDDPAGADIGRHEAEEADRQDDVDPEGQRDERDRKVMVAAKEPPAAPAASASATRPGARSRIAAIVATMAKPAIATSR